MTEIIFGAIYVYAIILGHNAKFVTFFGFTKQFSATVDSLQGGATNANLPYSITHWWAGHRTNDQVVGSNPGHAGHSGRLWASHMHNMHHVPVHIKR